MPKRRQPQEVKEETRRRVWERDAGRCQSPLRPPLCVGKPYIALDRCHIDHIIPLSMGGTNHVDNQRVLCPVCHVLRADRKHQGMISRALRLGLIPPNWRELVWEG